MSMPTERIGKLLALQRRAVDVDPAATYQEIGVRSFGRGLFVKPMVTGADLGGKRVFKIKDRDLVVSNVFAWEGAVAVASADHDEMIGSHRFMTWTPRRGNVDVGYLRHYFGSDAGLESLSRASPGSAGRNRTLSIDNFEAIEVPLPKIDEQRRIAAHLDRIVSATQYLIAAGGHERAVLDRLLDALSWSGLMQDLVQLDLDEVAIDGECEYRQIGVYAGGRGVIDRGTFRGSDTKYKSMLRVRTGQVVLSRLKAFEGAVAFVPEAHDGALVSREFPTFTLRSDVDPNFLATVLRSQRFERELKARSTGLGARRERVGVEQFIAILVPVAGKDVQHLIGSMASTVDRMNELERHRHSIGTALLPAARNEIFSAMR